MTTGALIFAFNNEHIDYVAMAAWSAKNIQRHLNIPVTLVTDRPVTLPVFEQIITVPTPESSTRSFSDYDALVTWHNTNRMDAYQLSPYDTTLVLDADYVVASDKLKTLLSTNYDFVCHRFAFDLTGIKDFTDLNWFGRHRMPMWWATVMLFQKCKTAELMFDHMRMIRQHWNHYVDVYGTGRSVYRNDHALSIALTTLNGHTLEAMNIPWDLASLTPDVKIIQESTDSYRVEFDTADGKQKWITLDNMDFHAMGKKQLGDIVADNS
jgi:hypothetical protein